MAWRSGVSTVSRVLFARRCHPSLIHVRRENADDDSSFSAPSLAPCRPYVTNFVPPNIFKTSIHSPHKDRRWLLNAPLAGVGLSFHRFMTGSSGESSHQFDEFVTEVIPDHSFVGASQLPAVNEVAIAAADSSLPVAALQHLIDGVHSFTGFNWWASIALTTIMIRGATIPLLINQMRSLTKLNLMRPRLEELNQKFKETAMESDAVSQHQRRVMALFREHGVTPFTPLKGLLIQGPIFVCFFLAIRNMAEKVPSFHTGGALWFVDLTTPDSLFVLPILTSLTFWILVECNMQEGMEGNPMTDTMKKYSRILALVAIPVTVGFPKAIFGYWLTSNLFSLVYGTVMRQPGIKKLLNIPEVLDSSLSSSQAMVSAPPTQQDNFTSDPAPPSPCSSMNEPQKLGSRRISSASVISQRIRSLQRKIKARNKAKKA